MTDVDFKECRLINEYLCYLTYDDFCMHRKIIKTMFDNLSAEGKMFYKYYVYANIHMEVKFKDIIWTYLNDATGNVEIDLLHLKNQYKVKL